MFKGRAEVFRAYVVELHTRRTGAARQRGLEVCNRALHHPRIDIRAARLDALRGTADADRLSQPGSRFHVDMHTRDEHNHRVEMEMAKFVTESAPNLENLRAERPVWEDSFSGHVEYDENAEIEEDSLPE